MLLLLKSTVTWKLLFLLIRLKCGEFLLLLIGHVNGRERSPMAAVHEDIRRLMGEKSASLIWAASQFGSTLDPEQRLMALHIQARRVLESLDLYWMSESNHRECSFHHCYLPSQLHAGGASLAPAVSFHKYLFVTSCKFPFTIGSMFAFFYRQSSKHVLTEEWFGNLNWRRSIILTCANMIRDLKLLVLLILNRDLNLIMLVTWMTSQPLMWIFIVSLPPKKCGININCSSRCAAGN